MRRRRPRRLLTVPLPRFSSDPSRISHAADQSGYSPAELPAGSTARYKTRHVVETVFQDQTFIGMGRRVCLDVAGVVQADHDVELTVGIAMSLGQFWNR